MLAMIRRARARRTTTGLEPERLAAVQAYTLRPPHPWPPASSRTPPRASSPTSAPVAAAIRRGFAGPELEPPDLCSRCREEFSGGGCVCEPMELEA